MPKVRVAGFGVSLDGFSAGTEQSLNDPLGKRGPEIFQWFFHTKTFCAMHGQEGGSIDGRWRTLGPSYLVSTCSVRCAAPGLTAHGRDGGATTRRTMRKRSS